MFSERNKEAKIACKKALDLCATFDWGKLSLKDSSNRPPSTLQDVLNSMKREMNPFGGSGVNAEAFARRKAIVDERMGDKDLNYAVERYKEAMQLQTKIQEFISEKVTVTLDKMVTVTPDEKGTVTPDNPCRLDETFDAMSTIKDLLTHTHPDQQDNLYPSNAKNEHYGSPQTRRVMDEISKIYEHSKDICSVTNVMLREYINGLLRLAKSRFSSAVEDKNEMRSLFVDKSDLTYKDYAQFFKAVGLSTEELDAAHKNSASTAPKQV